MEMGKRYLGTVTYPPNHQACYVRVQVPRVGEDLPLSIKATFETFGRHALRQGTIVRVERTSHNNHCRYRVAEILNREPLAEQTEETETMTIATEDKLVRFHLPVRYYTKARSSSGMTKDNCVRVMAEAFSMMGCHARNMLDDYPNGVDIVCRQGPVHAVHHRASRLRRLHQRHQGPEPEAGGPVDPDTVRHHAGGARRQPRHPRAGPEVYAGIENRKVQQKGVLDFSDHVCCEPD